MSTDRTDRGNDDLLDRYREASDQAGERPSASARASILAAAARQAGAKPTDARVPYRRARWPLAAAAAVMLSTLAVMLAIRTQDEMPRFEAPPESSAPSERPAAPPVSEAVQRDPKTAEQAPPLQPDSSQELPAQSRADGATPPADQGGESKRSSASKRANNDAGDRANGVPTADRRAKEGVVAQPDAAASASAPQSVSPAPAADSAPARTPAPIAKQRSEADANGMARSQPFGQSGAESASANTKRADELKLNEARPMSPPPTAAPADRSAESRRDSARSIAGATAPEPARSESVDSAAAWLERIIKLRRDGRHADADVELKLFRERYPHVQVPTEALPATGTR